MALEHRPTFALDLSAPLETVQARLRAARWSPWVEPRFAKTPAMPDRGQPTNHLILVHRLERRRFWSPWLTLDLQALDGGHTRVAGRFSPHPSIWIGFVFAYLGLGALSLFAAIFGFSQLSIGSSPTGFWVLCGTSVVAASMWWSSHVGQRWARTQMEELRLELEAALAEPEADAEPLRLAASA